MGAAARLTDPFWFGKGRFSRAMALAAECSIRGLLHEVKWCLVAGWTPKVGLLGVPTESRPTFRVGIRCLHA